MDWLSVTKEELVSCGVRQSLKKTDLGNFLTELYPHINWTRLHQWTSRFSQQRVLERVVSALFEVIFFPLIFFVTKSKVRIVGRRNESECPQRDCPS
jgi:hypothetical protein